VLGSTVDRERRQHWAWQRLTSVRRASATAHRRWPRATRRCRRGAHRSMSGGDEVAQRWWRMVMEASGRMGARAEGIAQKWGGVEW
jgi:hypothetical protein